MGCGSSTNTSATVASHHPSQDISDEQQPSCLAAEVAPSLQHNAENVSVVQSQALPSLDEQHSNVTSIVEFKNIGAGLTYDNGIAETGITERIDKLPLDKVSNELEPIIRGDDDIIAPLADKKVCESMESKPKVKKFNRCLKQACQLTPNERLLETSSYVETLELDRSFYSFTKSDLLCKVISTMKFLHTLNLSGGQMGPIAFRFIVTSLRHNTTIKHLDLSDNLANPECSAATGSLLATNSTLEDLNLSGNRLGKDSLSRHVGSAILQNYTLKSLDISNCGATDLHCLCESIRNSTCSSLVTFKAADNTISDDHQFVEDLSLILENTNCKLKDIDVSNTSICSSAMDKLIESISKNISICTLQLGKNAISTMKNLCMVLMNACTHPNMTVFSIGKTKVDDPAPCDFTECKICEERNLSVSNLQHLDVADCSIDSNLLQYLASQLGGKLSKLVFLDISKNDIGPKGLNSINQLTKCQLQKLNLMHLQKSNGIVEAIVSQFTNLSQLDFTRAKLSHDDTKRLVNQFFHHETSLSLNGLKLGGLGIFSELRDMQTSSHLRELHLSVCQLSDVDMNPLCDLLGQSMLSFPLRRLDVSVNRLTSSFIRRLIESVLKHSQHTLQSIKASNNAIDGGCLDSLSKLFTSVTHSSSVDSVNLSHNEITANSIIHFLSSVKNRRFPLQQFDLSYQNDKFIESDMEDLANLLKETFHAPCNMWSDCDFAMDLRGNGGSETPHLCLVDSAAIKTDFVMKRKPELALRDLIEIMKGIYHQNGGDDMPHRYPISTEIWKEVVLKDAPAWVLVNSELSKAAYMSHMPSTATSQKIRGMLEMDADCDVEDLFLVKDPMTQQSTGAAWVLFENTKSLNEAINWFYEGNAFIFGNQFSISEIPLYIANESDNAIDTANKDLKMRNMEAKQQLEIDKKVLEESMQLAAERAEYRELHPAYQGGRIS